MTRTMHKQVIVGINFLLGYQPTVSRSDWLSYQLKG